MTTLSSGYRLIVRVEREGESCMSVTPMLRPARTERFEILDEGVDPFHSPLGRPVHWRVECRGDEHIYCSTFQATRDEVARTFGDEGLGLLDPGQNEATVTIETILTRGVVGDHVCKRASPRESDGGPGRGAEERKG